MNPRLPYVYELIHKTTKEFYIGSRWANTVYSEMDLGNKYFTSSKNIKKRFKEFNFRIIADFFNKEDAFIFEQNLIEENKNNPLLLNKRYFSISKKMLKNVTSGKKTDEQRKKMSLAKKGKIPKHSLDKMKTWYLINPEGETMQTKNLSEFCREHNLNQGCLSLAAQGKINAHKGWKCYTLS
jgi:hypothetical protein